MAKGTHLVWSVYTQRYNQNDIYATIARTNIEVQTGDNFQSPIVDGRPREVNGPAPGDNLWPGCRVGKMEF
jgi:hypothetical protein